jgi:hypothetical protein
MSFVVSSLANYTDEQRTDLLTRSLFGSKTAEMLFNAGQVQVGVKSASALNILTSTVFFQSDGCGYSPSGLTTYTQRNITVGAIKVEETLCPKTLEAKWMQTQIAPGSAVEVPFEEQIGREKASRIAKLLEVAMWQGDTASTNTNPNTNRFDGFNKIIDAASASTIAGNTISATAITTSNIDDILDAMYAVIPSDIATESDLVCFCGIDTYKKYLVNLKNANLFHYMADATAEMQTIIPGTNVKLVAVGGLDGTNRLFMSTLSNFYIGTDLIDELEEFKFWYSQDADEVRYRASMKFGCQVGFPDFLVQFKLA